MNTHRSHKPGNLWISHQEGAIYKLIMPLVLLIYTNKHQQSNCGPKEMLENIYKTVRNIHKKECTFLNKNNHHFNCMLMKGTTDSNDNGLFTF